MVVQSTHCIEKGEKKYESLEIAYEECSRQKTCSEILDSECAFDGKLILCLNKMMALKIDEYKKKSCSCKL